MTASLAVGMTHRASLEVDEARTIAFLGEALRVYATPAIVSDTEYACLDFLQRHCEASESSVGAYVEIHHLKPTPLGAPVALEITVAAIEGPRVTFEASVRDAVEEVARLRHQRVVVDKARLARAVAAKKAKLERAP